MPRTGSCLFVVVVGELNNLGYGLVCGQTLVVSIQPHAREG